MYHETFKQLKLEDKDLAPATLWRLRNLAKSLSKKVMMFVASVFSFLTVDCALSKVTKPSQRCTGGYSAHQEFRHQVDPNWLRELLRDNVLRDLQAIKIGGQRLGTRNISLSWLQLNARMAGGKDNSAGQGRNDDEIGEILGIKSLFHL